jgi:hypothetical protein
MGVAARFIGHYRAPSGPASGPTGMWYVEYEGWPAVRQFVITVDDLGRVAPFDLPFHDRTSPDGAPEVSGITVIDRATFEEAWARWAQPRLHEVAREPLALEVLATRELHYFCDPFPAELKGQGESGSLLYTEYSAGIARRHFEVWGDGRVAVAPFDVKVPEMNGDEVLRIVHEGVDAEGEPVDPQLRGEEITHTVFEAEWERLAFPSLLARAGIGVSEPSNGGDA